MQLTDVPPKVQPRNSAASLRSWLWPLVIVLSSIGVSVVVLADVHSPVRPLLAFWFLCLCPGMAFVRLLDIEEGYIQLTLAIALSLALDTAVATALLYAHRWSPAHTLGLLAGLSLVGVALDVTGAHRKRRTAGRSTAPLHAAPFVALPDVVRVVPGERLVLALTVQNNRSMAGHYHIDVSGLPAEWYDLATPHVVLGPGRRERVKLTVHPTAGTVPPTSGYPMTVRVMAEDGLSIEATLIVMSVRAATTARVLVSTRDGVGMEVQPAEAVGEEATFSVAFLNRSPAPVALEAVVQAQRNGLRVHITPHTRLLIPPGKAAGPLTVHVVPKRRRLRGVPRRYELVLRGRQLGRDALMHPDLVLPARFTYMPREVAPALRWRRGGALVLLLFLLAYVGEQRLATVLRHALARSSAPRTGVTRQQGPAQRVPGRSIQPPVARRNPTLLSPVALLNPTRLSWGAQSVKTASAPLLIHVVNVGLTPLTMTHVIIGGMNPRDFTARSTCAPHTLGSYDGCTVAVRFTPLASGTRRATLIIRDNAVDSLQQVPLTGHGLTQQT